MDEGVKVNIQLDTDSIEDRMVDIFSEIKSLNLTAKSIVHSIVLIGRESMRHLSSACDGIVCMGQKIQSATNDLTNSIGEATRSITDKVKEIHDTLEEVKLSQAADSAQNAATKPID